MSATLRGRDAQLAQAREQQLLDERIVALGTQAASAAHEMNTPLATVALIAGELCIEAGRNDALRLYREDLAIVEQQIALCKTALDRMGMIDPSSQIDTSLSLAQWLRHFFDSWRLRHPTLVICLSVAERTGPVHHPQLLAQVLSTREDGGILSRAGVVDYSIGKGVAPGVFCVVKPRHPRVMERLTDLKVGPGPCYTIFRPYHLTSLEVPLSALKAAVHRRADMQPLDRPVAECVAVAQRGL
eukprot:gene37569-45113_t